MATVNPPPILRKPREFQSNKDVRFYLDSLERIIFQLWTRLGGGTDLIAEVDQDALNTLAGLNALQQQVGSGDFLTVDTTGFTVDTTMIFADQVEA